MIKSHFEQMNRREQILVLMTATILIIYLAFLFIFEPITTAKTEAAKELQEKKITLSWMNQVKGYAGKPSRKNINDNSQLLSLLTLQLLQPSLKPFPYQLQQNGAGNVQLSYDHVPFNSFIEWLMSFQTKYSVTIDQLDATKGDQEGVVKLNVTLKP